MELIIFIGIQGTGKSTFYKERFFKTHLRINLDMLKTRHRELVLFQTCLQITQRMVIDNTNPTPEDRARYIIPARESGFRIAGYYFQSRIRDALIRNSQREGKERIPDKGVLATHARLVRPSYQEGFDELYYVSIDTKGFFRIEEWQVSQGDPG
jgi:predicted kinase